MVSSSSYTEIVSYIYPIFTEIEMKPLKIGPPICLFLIWRVTCSVRWTEEVHSILLLFLITIYRLMN